jgi:MFS family permease
MISRTATMLAPDLRSETRWLSCGFVLMFWSSFGQTFYIALFAGHLKADLGLSDGQFGSLYAIGTLASACVLVWAGKLADRFPIRWLAAGVLGGLALTCLATASVTSAWMLGVVLFGLRFFGQGMTTHVAMTAMGRWFNRKRGRAVAIATLGFPVG